MEIDECIFSALDAINIKWTEHAADTEVSDMQKEIARQKAQLESQKEEIDKQQKDIKKLHDAVELRSLWSPYPADLFSCSTEALN
eukprot:scaffold18734_cov115-Skeletonema_dohrnii-CCMP3373.AAC.7